jgi:hypothetical protein
MLDGPKNEGLVRALVSIDSDVRIEYTIGATFPNQCFQKCDGTALTKAVGILFEGQSYDADLRLSPLEDSVDGSF